MENHDHLRIGKIVKLQTDTSPGELTSEDKLYPYLSEKIWQIGDIVNFGIKKIKHSGKEIELAFNLFMPGHTHGIAGPDHKKNGIVTQPPFNVGQYPPQGYEFIVLNNVLHIIEEASKDALINSKPGILVHYHTEKINIPGFGVLNVLKFISNNNKYKHINKTITKLDAVFPDPNDNYKLVELDNDGKKYVVKLSTKDPTTTLTINAKHYFHEGQTITIDGTNYLILEFASDKSDF